jgi:carboxymethylenebutenolidase
MARLLNLIGMAIGVLICAGATPGAAQPTDYGPRLLGPHDTEERWGAFETDGAETEVRYFVVRPQDDKPYPGVYYIYGRPGLDDRLLQEFRRLASFGFMVFTAHYHEALLMPPFSSRVDPDSAFKIVEDGLDVFLKLPGRTSDKPCVIATVRGGQYMVKMAAKGNFTCMIGYHAVLINHAWPEQFQEVTLLQEMRKVRIPTLLMIGSADYEVRQNQSKRAAQYLESRGVPVDLVVYPGAGRGFDFRIVDRSLADDMAKMDSMYRAVAFLNKHMGRENPAGPLLGPFASAPVPSAIRAPFPGVPRLQVRKPTVDTNRE